MQDAKGSKNEGPSPLQAQVSWRQLSTNDIPSLARIAENIHTTLPERDEVFAERVKLFPAGCLGLVEDKSVELCGYAISHPIKHRQPPALDSLLGEIPSDADQYYIHDIAILPKLRGGGLAHECIKKLFVIAKRYPSTCLISVYGTERFWSQFGFEPVQIDEVLSKKVREYGDDARYLERKNEGYEQQTTTTGAI